MNNEQQSLQNWFHKQIDETIDDIRWAESHNTPANETLVWELKYRLSYLESELDNLIYPLDK